MTTEQKKAMQNLTKASENLTKAMIENIFLTGNTEKAMQEYEKASKEYYKAFYNI